MMVGMSEGSVRRHAGRAVEVPLAEREGGGRWIAAVDRSRDMPSGRGLFSVWINARKSSHEEQLAHAVLNGVSGNQPTATSMPSGY